MFQRAFGDDRLHSKGSDKGLSKPSTSASSTLSCAQQFPFERSPLETRPGSPTELGQILTPMQAYFLQDGPQVIQQFREDLNLLRKRVCSLERRARGLGQQSEADDEAANDHGLKPETGSRLFCPSGPDKANHPIRGLEISKRWSCKDVAEVWHEVRKLSELEANDVKAISMNIEDLRKMHSLKSNQLDAALDATRKDVLKLTRECQLGQDDRRLDTMGPISDDTSCRLMDPAVRSAMQDLKAHIERMFATEMKSFERTLDDRIKGALHLTRRSKQLDSDQTLGALRGRIPARDVARHSAAQAKQVLPASPGDSDGEARISAAVNTVLAGWTPETVFGDVNATKVMLMHFGIFAQIRISGVPDDLVTRPTFRFVHSVIQVLIITMGYPWAHVADVPELREEKICFLEDAWKEICTTFGIQDRSFNADDVLRCMKRGQTRRLLQLVVLAASKEKSQAKQDSSLNSVSYLRRPKPDGISESGRSSSAMLPSDPACRNLLRTRSLTEQATLVDTAL